MIKAFAEKDWPRGVFVSALVVATIPVGLIVLIFGILYSIMAWWFREGMAEFDENK